MGDHQCLELGHEIRVPTECEVCLHSLFERAELELLEAADLRLREILVSELRQGRPPPERVRLAELLGRRTGVSARERAPRLAEELLEAVGIDLAGLHLQDVARSPR